MCLQWLLVVSLIFSPNANAILPKSYNAKLNLKNHFHTELRNTESFSGFVEIVAQKVKTNNEIKLNAWRIDVISTNITCENKKINVSLVQHEKYVDDTVTFHLESNISAGETCNIQIKFNAPFSELYGLYKSYFPSKFDTGYKFVSIATNNEPEMTRLWVPCVDRMDVTANWTIKIIHPMHTRVFGMAPAHTRKEANHQISTIQSIRPWQTSKVAFAVIEEKRFKTYSTKSVSNQTLRFWFPRNITFRKSAKDILNISSTYFTQLTDLFSHKVPCKNIEFVILQHKTGYSSGCLVFLDQRYDQSVVDLKRRIGHLWLGSEVLYPSIQDSWFVYSLSSYLSIALDKWTTAERAFLLKSALEDNMILEEPLVSKYETTTHPSGLVKNKGALVVSMLADVMEAENFNAFLKELLRRFAGNHLHSDRIFYLVREFTNKDRWPACYRAFIGTQTEFVGLPIVYLNRDNGTIVFTQFNYEVKDRSDPRFRPWFFTSQWTFPLFMELNSSSELFWLHHDDQEIQMEMEDAVLIDPEARGLYLVDYRDNEDLFTFWNFTEDCNRFHRFCLDPSINKDFCGTIYSKSCSLSQKPSPLIYTGYRHRWDEEQ